MIEVVVAGVPAGSLLVRIALSAGGEVTLPRPPAPHAVTVTVGTGTPPALIEALDHAGYRVAGETTGTAPGVVDLLVTPALRDAGSVWWDHVAARADRIFDVRMGPVAHVLDRELTLHAAALDR